MVPDPIQDSPSSFARKISSPMLVASQHLPPPMRRHRRTPPTSLLQHSRRLAAKARNRLPTMVTAQNMLMRKLGLATDVHVESADYTRLP
jgi:hypothetical protein